ncbi:MAG: divalent-cation tolerance protein CutA [Candidatus Eisenbacteria bacterium]|nr:divalent-cation tolerance protein CutA [Candidatus Eisenbacteria bacterium]
MILIQTTLPSEQAAHDIALALVTERLAACAHIHPIASVYRWKGEVAREQEWIVVFKTRERLYARVAARIRALHSYDVPEIIALPIDGGSPDYLAWIEASTLSHGEPDEER